MAKKKTAAKKKVTTRVTKPKKKITPLIKEKFLVTFRVCGLIGKSSLAAGICPETLRVHREKDAEFGAAIDDAYLTYTETLEAAAHLRAVDGLEEPIYQGGKLVGKKRVFSDHILALMLKRHIAAYREKQSLDININGGVFVAPLSGESSKEWEKRNREDDNGKG